MSIKERLEALGAELEAEYRDNPVSRFIGRLHAEVVKIEARVAEMEGHPAVSIPPLTVAAADADSTSDGPESAPTALMTATEAIASQSEQQP